MKGALKTMSSKEEQNHITPRKANRQKVILDYLRSGYRSNGGLRKDTAMALDRSRFLVLALALAACGGGGEKDAESDNGPDIQGNLIKGPVQGARVFVDYNNNENLTQANHLRSLMKMEHMI